MADLAKRQQEERRREAAARKGGGSGGASSPAGGGASDSDASGGGGAGWQPPRLSGNNAYSRFVGLMKVALPATAVALGLLIIAWPQLFPEEEMAGLSFNPLDREQAQNVSMLNARFQGRDEEDRPFEILADEARQPDAGGEQVDLSAPKAELLLEDGNLLGLTSNNGQYWRDQRRLTLDGAVTLTHDQGFQLDTSAAEVDLRAGRAWGEQPVSGQGPTGRIESQGFELEDSGEVIVFTGRSHLTLRPEGEDESAPDGQNGAQAPDAEADNQAPESDAAAADAPAEEGDPQ